MNKKMITYVLGILLITEGALLLLPTLIALYYKENVVPFLITIAATVASGFVMTRFKPHDKTIVSMDGFAIVSLGWILISLFGALPFFISKEISNYLDAVFEVVSGFTTTGSSILTNVEALSKGMLFWRSFTHWIGGMGALAFIMAILPLAKGGGNLQLMKAESPGPDVEKLVPKSKSTARILYGIYVIMTIVQILLLRCGGLSFFESTTLSFGTAGTGGFAIVNSSIADYSLYTQIIIGVFMMLFGINFNFYFLLFCGKLKAAFRNVEVKSYIGIMATSIILIALNIRHMFGSFFEALHQSAFQVSSVMTTTGYATTDFDKWPVFSRTVMLIVMCVGACAGSTGGGIKVSRLLIAGKTVVKELRSYIHPKIITKVKMDGKPIEHEVVRATNVYVMTFVVIFTASVFAVSFEGHDLVTNFTAVAATINNIGPGLSLVGPAANFNFFSPISKYVLMFDMLVLPAQAPQNISMTRIVWLAFGHKSKFAVAKPVVVIIEPT